MFHVNLEAESYEILTESVGWHIWPEVCNAHEGDSLWMDGAMVMGRRAQREISYLISCESEQFNSERRT